MQQRFYPRCAIALIAVVALSFPAQLFGTDKSQVNSVDQHGRELRATRLVGMAVSNSRGDTVARIDDLIITDQGAIDKVVLALNENILGMESKLVAVDFQSLRFERDWSYRSYTAPDGTQRRVAWESTRSLTYLGNADELKDLPAYQYADRHPRGGTSGWGIYSYPAGPSSADEINNQIFQKMERGQ